VKRLTITLLALALVGCGGAQGSASSGDEYSGPNELDFFVTTPVRRQMPTERHRGTARVVADDGSTLTLELRMVDQGDVCTITATHANGAMPVAPAQCSSRFVYEENPTSAIVSIREGTVTLGDRSLEVELSGDFTANVQQGGDVSEVGGVAQWSFSGTR